MRFFGKSRFNIVHAGIAAAVLGLGALSAATAQAQQQAYTPARSSTASDSDVAERVKAALKASPTLDSRHIKVSVEKGDVVLRGFVQSETGLTDATQVATKAAGDHKVINNLTIKQNYSNGAT